MILTTGWWAHSKVGLGWSFSCQKSRALPWQFSRLGPTYCCFWKGPSEMCSKLKCSTYDSCWLWTQNWQCKYLLFGFFYWLFDHVLKLLYFSFILSMSCCFNQVVQNLLACLDSPELPFLQWQECMSVLANRLPKDLRNEVNIISLDFTYAANFWSY